MIPRETTATRTIIAQKTMCEYKPSPIKRRFRKSVAIATTATPFFKNIENKASFGPHHAFLWAVIIVDGINHGGDEKNPQLLRID